MSGSQFGGTGAHTATVPMNFRGQDKRSEQKLGANPNADIEDEYISNL